MPDIYTPPYFSERQRAALIANIEAQRLAADQASARNAAIWRLRRQGKTFQEIADVLGMTRARVGQIIEKGRDRGIDLGDDRKRPTPNTRG